MNMSGSRERAARLRFTSISNKLREADLKAVFDRSVKKLNSLQRVPDALNAFWGDIRTMCSLLGAYLSGAYPQVPWRSLLAMSAALLYFVVPMDALPDFVPVTGYIDDAFIFKLVLDLVATDLEAFKRWRDGGVLIEHHRL